MNSHLLVISVTSPMTSALLSSNISYPYLSLVRIVI